MVAVLDALSRGGWWALYGLFVIGLVGAYVLVMILVTKCVWWGLVNGLVKLGLPKWLSYVMGALVVGGIGLGSFYGFWVGVSVPVSDSQFFGPRIFYKPMGGVLDPSISEEVYWRDLDALMFQEAKMLRGRGGEISMDLYGLDTKVRILPQTLYGWNWATIALVGFGVMGVGLVVYGVSSVLGS